VHTGTIEPWPAGRTGPIVWTVLSKLEPRAARRVATAFAVVAFLFALTSTSALAATTYAARCDSVNLRSGPSTTYAIKKSVAAGTQVTVVATVSGGSYSTTCLGVTSSGSSWLRITAISGKTVSSLYGVTYVYGASTLFKAVVIPTAPPTGTPAPSPQASGSGAPSATTSPSASPGPSGSPAAPGSPDPSASPSTSPTPSPTPTPTPPGPTTLGASVTFYGRGYGHGVGLSQYGAYGRAAAGETYQTILAHYYRSTTLGASSSTQIRVLVLSGFATSSTNPLKLYGLGGTWTVDGIATIFPADALARLIPAVSGSTVTWKLVVTSSTGAALYSGATTGNIRLRPAGTSTVLRLYSKPSSYDRYRGVLHVRTSTGSTAVSVVNEVGLEDYLKGVVPSEMSSSWPAAALKAQAIAARSYAVRRLHPTTGTYDVFDDTRSQVYHGVLAEKSTTTSAVIGTAGIVLKYGSSVANALYHSAGGGATESNQNVFNSATGAITSSPVAYLQGSMDRDATGAAYDHASPYATWHTATYSLAQVQAFFAADSRTNVGTLVALDLTHRGVGERLISVTLYGANGSTKTVSGSVFLSVFNAQRPSSDAPMRDTLFDLAPIP